MSKKLNRGSVEDLRHAPDSSIQFQSCCLFRFYSRHEDVAEGMKFLPELVTLFLSYPLVLNIFHLNCTEILQYDELRGTVLRHDHLFLLQSGSSMVLDVCA